MTRAFRGRLKPSYQVITKIAPEQIDGLSLKFRDMQVISQMMRDYIVRYTQSIETEMVRCGNALDLDATLPSAARELEDLIRILFSAYLSTFESVLYYLSEVDQSASAWIGNQRKKRKVLATLDRLRNMDVHHEPLHSYIGTRFRIHAIEHAESSVETKDTHVHFGLQHEGPGLAPEYLAKTKPFESHPKLVDVATFESLLQLTHTGLHEIISVFGEHAARFGRPLPAITCSFCASVRLSQNSNDAGTM